MTDEELIKEFSQLVRKTLETRGQVHFTTNDLQETSVVFDSFRLTKGFFVNGEKRWSVFGYKRNVRVFFESEGGPGIYGVGDAKPDYHIAGIKELLPVLLKETVLDQMASL